MIADSDSCDTSATDSHDGSVNDESGTPPRLVEMPKHISFPEMLCGDSELLNELIMCLFILFNAGMQFINIYRTVWWLPDSYTNHTLNLYLVEPYLILFIVIMITRRLIYCLLVHGIEYLTNSTEQSIYKILVKFVFTLTFLSSVAFCIAKIYNKHSYISFFLLIYPVFVYILVFGLQIEPFLRTNCEFEGSYFNGMPMHCCSSNPTNVREEIDILKRDFNNRFKQVIFTSILNAYYAGFVPCFFAQNFINYNVLWATQHIIFVWLSAFTLCIMYCFPAKYSDILHRSALHLGHWLKIDKRFKNTTIADLSVPEVMLWSESDTWSNGSIVHYTGEQFRCIGPVTMAQPGSTCHSRFFMLFQNPSNIYMVLTGLQALIVALQMLLLYSATEWHFILSISFVMLTNQFTFFKAMRNYLITKHIYAAEQTSIAEN